MNTRLPGSRRFRALGVPVDALQMPEVIERMEQWIALRSASHYIAVTNAHGVVVAQQDPSFKKTLESADMVIPDGMPLVWIGRRNGHRMPERVCGPDLFAAFCQKTQAKGYSHFLYGGAPGAPEALAAVLTQRYPGLRVAGMYSPPFRALTPEEDENAVRMINESGADVLWVGLGCPKQERWMYEHRDRLTVPAVIGVGAAFDFVSGRLPRAPRILGDNGLEWVYRLWREPRRLWRRYLVSNSSFLFYCFQEMLGLRRS